jgi:hypothetical protein
VGVGQLEVLLRALREDARREGPERLAELDLRVDDVLHLGAPRVSDDRAVAERARPELEPALVPADHLSPATSSKGISFAFRKSAICESPYSAPQ